MISTASAMVAASITAKPATGSVDRMNGPVCVTSPIVVTHLHGRTGDSHFCSLAEQQSVMRVRRVSHARVGTVVSRAIAVANRHELRQRGPP
jgi:hypothetical protein